MRGRVGLAELLGGLGHDDEDEDEAPRKLTPLQLAALAESLQEKLRSLHTKHEFKVGDLICLTPGMKNLRWPDYGEPVIVTEVLEAPHIDTEGGPGSNHFMERKDIRIGIITSGGEFNEFVVDSRRFQPWEPPAL